MGPKASVEPHSEAASWDYPGNRSVYSKDYSIGSAISDITWVRLIWPSTLRVLKWCTEVLVKNVYSYKI